MSKGPAVLIVSWSPVPTPKYQKIEGSGQRFFGLANGLKKNGVDDVTIAVGGIYPLDVKEIAGIKLINYDLNSDFAEKLTHYDTIIFNYTIHGSAFIVEHLPENAQVIIDAYGPAYIENLARRPEDMVGTYVGNLAAVKEVFNKVLVRGDYYLYANSSQEKLYSGVLAALGVINQFSYHTERLLCVPFGIDKPDANAKYINPYPEYGIKESDFTLLWFGGLYPWFDITKLLKVIEAEKQGTLKLVIVGGNNPQNQHPDFIKHYKNTVDYIERHNLGDRVILVDWADFATRRRYYEYADAIISLNSEGKENAYSWRTRVMDYVGSKTPLITNGGDPLSDELVEAGAAFKIDEKSNESIRTLLQRLEKNPSMLNNASKKMIALQPKYYWETVTKSLAQVILAQTKPYGEEQDFRLQYGISNSPLSAQTSRRSIKPVIRRVIRKVGTDGVLVTYTIAKDKVLRRAKHEYYRRAPGRTNQKPRVVIVSNQFNYTGAPLVLIDLLKELIAKVPKIASSIRFITFTPVEIGNISSLRKLSIKPEIFTNRELGLDFNKGDVVVFNTFAISNTTSRAAISAIKEGKAKKLYWYGHESSPEGFIDTSTRVEIVGLLKKNRAKIYAVSNATLREYQRFFGQKENIEKVQFPFKIPERYFKPKGPEDFNRLHFTITGSLMDMRKGQYPLLYAFLDFYHNKYTQNPEKYRDFKIEFIGAYEKSDLTQDAAYHVRNILKQFTISAKPLGDRFVLLPGLTHKEALERIEAANITVCYSLSEALGIFVYEGMANGHPIIRNESAGQEEQLMDGENGLAVSSDDFPGLVDAIETILNKSKTTNQALADMSKKSLALAQEATKKDFSRITDDLIETFTLANKRTDR